jgi:hypothetical protein
MIYIEVHLFASVGYLWRHLIAPRRHMNVVSVYRKQLVVLVHQLRCSQPFSVWSIVFEKVRWVFFEKVVFVKFLIFILKYFVAIFRNPSSQKHDTPVTPAKRNISG